MASSIKDKMTETPKYSIIHKHKNIEIRQYPAMIQAEVTVSGKLYRSAAETGFRVLAGFIFGNNISRQKIDMTTPVQASRSEKIAMTTPVTISGQDEFTVAFIMPSAYTLESLPQPTDARVRFNPFPARQMAAIQFSGYFNQDTIQKKALQLDQWLEENGYRPFGEHIVAGYNPPWVPGFLARNEVLLQLHPDPDQ